MRLSRLPQPARRVRITLTSLVDVVFILLFFFMLASQQLGWRALDLDLAPPAGAARPPPETQDTLRVTLDAEGRLALEGEALVLSELQVRVAAHAPRGPVQVTPLAGVRVDALVRLLDALEPQGARLLLGGGR